MGLAVPKRDKSPEEPKGDSTPKTPQRPLKRPQELRLNQTNLAVSQHTYNK